MGKLTKKKASKMLHEKEIKGHPITKKQRGYFGAVASGKARKRK